jgi:hypothetical protein
VDDWVNPQRPKPELLRREFDLLIAHAVAHGRLRAEATGPLAAWFDQARRRMATYRPDHDEVAEFEQMLLRDALSSLPGGSRA